MMVLLDSLIDRPRPAVLVVEFKKSDMAAAFAEILSPVAPVAARGDDALRFRGALLAAQLEASPDGILVVDESGRMVSFNRRFVEMWGIPPAVAATRSDARALRSVLDKVVDPKGFLQRVRHLYRRRDERSVDELELKDGRAFERHSAPIFGPGGMHYGRIWFFRDITARRRAEAALRSSEEKYHRLFASASHAILIIDGRSGRVVEANEAALGLYGYSAEDLEGMKAVALSAEPAKTKASMREMLAHRRTLVKTRLHKRKDGTVFPVEIACGVFDWNGRRMLIAMVTDLTDHIQAHEARALREKERIQREFLANASHELRTPIAAILGFAETLVGAGMDDVRRRRGFAKAIQRHAQRLGGLVDDLLDLSSLEAGGRRPRPERIDLSDYLRRFAAGLAPVARRRKITLRVSAGAGLAVSIDETHLNRMLQNLLDNAIKHSRPGDRVAIAARRADGGIRLSISDTGVGIPSADLPRIFERFHRSQLSVARRIGGTGLGLSLVKSLVEANGGRVWAESAEGRGATFHITLPSA